jgi:hypothetical protein
LRYSRWRRLPIGLFRSGERKPIGGDEELQPLSIYVPGRVLDQAEALANAFRSPSIQAFCERLLPEALNMVQAQVRLASSEQTRAVLEAIDALDHGLLARLMPAGAIEESRGPFEAEEVEEPLPEIRVTIGGAEDLSPSPFEARVTRVEARADRSLLEELVAEGRAGRVEAGDVDRLLLLIGRLEEAWQESLTIDRQAALALGRMKAVIARAPHSGALVELDQAIDRLLDGGDDES